MISGIIEIIMRVAPTGVWLAGMISTIYLVGLSLLLSFYSLGFINHSSPDFAWWKVAKIVKSLIPVCGFAAIGLIGLPFWRRGRLPIWRFALVFLQIGAAILAYFSPEYFLEIANLFA